jgi:hypothetical protein
VSLAAIGRALAGLVGLLNALLARSERKAAEDNGAAKRDLEASHEDDAMRARVDAARRAAAADDRDFHDRLREAGRLRD